MKAEGIKSIGNVISRVIKGSAKAEAAKADVAVKEGEKLMAAGQDAAAVQGKAMVKPYVKPEMDASNMKKQNLKAASGGRDHGQGGRGDYSADDSGSSIWDNDYEWHGYDSVF